MKFNVFFAPPVRTHRRASLENMLYRIVFLGSTLLLAGMVATRSTSVRAGEVAETESVLEQVAKLNQHIREGETAAAAALARQLDEAAPLNVDLSLSLAQIARASQSLGDHESASDLFRRACAALDRPAAGQMAAETASLIRLSAAWLFVKTHQVDDAITALETSLADAAVMTVPQKQGAVDLCLELGDYCLHHNRTDVASKAYELAMAHTPSEKRAKPMLGAAFSAALAGDRPIEAANRMLAFVDAFPTHPDAANSLRAGITCLTQMKALPEAVPMQNDAAPLQNKVTAELLRRFPESTQAAEVVASYSHQTVDQIPASVRRWVVERIIREDGQSLDANLVSMAMRIASDESHTEIWEACQLQLGQKDQTGQTTADVLAALPPADAERLVAFLLAPPTSSGIGPLARESACRWAGRGEKWSLLAMAAESTSVEIDDASRTATMERLFAEALMQMGQRDEAHRWWTQLVDHRGVDDFATLLRCAETESSLGTVDGASKRIAAAALAAGEDRFRRSLVAMLAAELSIRRTRFDEARGELESVVRTGQLDTSLRGRAQWMIGETFYLQQRYTEAIDAYRLVAGIDPDGEWVAAALAEAGKCFEQLGRTRDAAVCYSTLVSRHSDSQYAALASRRLAALAPAEPTKPGSPSNSNKTLRR
ncbi:tetratricopeptide repeat protein [Novipirellula artificiosorum]|nr:tetratricopeptide repeat protein [Novipirellula artificiosorum]